MPLTDHIIKNTKHDPSRRVALTDGHGLQLRISMKNDRSWSFQYRFKGRMKKLTLGNWPSISCTKARRLANDARYSIARGIDPQEEKQKATIKKPKFEEIWAMFDELYIAKSVKEKTAKDYRQIAAKNILPKLGKRNLDEVERVEVVRLIDHVATRAPILANRTLGLLKQFFNWAIGRGDIAMNPAIGIPKPIKELKRNRVLSLSEMRRIYSAAESLSPANALFIQLLLLTGQRAGVIAKLTSDEWNGDYLEIAGDRNKSGERILVPLPQIAQEKIASVAHTNGSFLLSTTNGYKPINGFSKLKKKLDYLSGITEWRLHDIRRGISTHFEDNGVDRFYVERLLNHKDNSVTGIYAKSNHLEMRRNIFEQWSRVLTSKDGSDANNVITFRGATGWSA
ncbi:integrase arm-type DNA-binding domain-containing protein [Planktomarina temperata]|nr:integrase arm-type DNA-binding domain-containing protein [Planktomarina temperata]